jgi:hypothetical protein
MSAAISSSELNPLWGTRLKAIRLDAHRPEGRFDLFWTDQGEANFASLIFSSIQYSRFEFDESIENEVVELVSVEAESCPVGIRLFGELSNGTFEFVCASFRVERQESGGVA